MLTFQHVTVHKIRSNVMDPDGAFIEPLCQYLADHQRYGDLYRLLKTNHQIQARCQPYLDQLIERLWHRDPDDLLKESCYLHDKALYNLAIQLGAGDFGQGLYGACQGGHADLVGLMIKKGAKNFNRGLVGACQGGHLGLVKLMIKKGADMLNWALENVEVCPNQEIGHTSTIEYFKIVKYLIKHGADPNWLGETWSHHRR